MSVAVYSKASVVAESPRDAEQRALIAATTRLQQAADRRLQGPALVEALHYNRELWRVFADDCAAPGNRLAAETRAAIVSLSLFVSRHSTEVAAGREPLTPLIDVNRLVAEGLSSTRRVSDND